MSEEDRKLRIWLLHTITTAARHYTEARKLVGLQNSTDQLRDGGIVLHILDVYEQIEGSVMAIHRACMAIRRLRERQLEAAEFIAVHEASLGSLIAIRNQYEHMHTQIVASQTGTGPISMTFGDSGKRIKNSEICRWIRPHCMDLSKEHIGLLKRCI
ncbi:hypothetical protein [Herbaspirillum lusitanum]|uniref:hypothetical protein n=1 Tax=Herbaspirillum lusitanum TaxID=213312 RepID=UPI002238E34C|nr:hypothetical protein [Herbaspirillum lusitanum]